MNGRAAPVGQHGVSVRLAGRKGEEGEYEEEEFRPLPMEMDFSMHSLRPHTSTLRGLPPAHTPPNARQNQPITAPLRPRGEESEQRGRDAHRDRTSREIGGSLDQLWHRFSERWSQEQSQSTNNREASLLERLERLSRLINSSSLTHSSVITHSPTKQATNTQASTQTQTPDQPDQPIVEPKRRERGKSKKKERKEKVSGVEEKKEAREEGQKRGGAPHLAWVEPETQSSSHVAEDEPERLGRCPAETDSISMETSVSTETSMSTIDTQRLLRAFGPNRVRTLPAAEKGRDSLLKLYGNIYKQRSTVSDDSTVRPIGISLAQPGPGLIELLLWACL